MAEYGVASFHPDLQEKELLEFFSLDRTAVPDDRPYTVSNSLTSLDGVIDLDEPGLRGPKPISLSDVPGSGGSADWTLLNTGWTLADAVLISGSILRSEPEIVCTPRFEWMRRRRLAARQTKGLSSPEQIMPVQVVLSGSGEVDLHHQLFQQTEAATVIATTPQGRQQILNQVAQKQLLSHPHVIVCEHDSAGRISLSQLLKILRLQHDIHYLEVDCGGQVIMQMLSEGLLDETRITLAGHICGTLNSMLKPRPTLFPCPPSGWPVHVSPLLRFVGVRRHGNNILFIRGAWTYRH